MCDIKDFLASHPHISINSIERELSIPTGTVRISSSRPIPQKYIDPIKQVLYNYGMKDDNTETSQSKTAVHKSDIPTQTYITRNNVIGIMDGLIFRRIMLEDNTVIIVQ